MTIIAELAADTARALLRWVRKLGRQILERLAKRTGLAAVDYFRRRAAIAERRREGIRDVLKGMKRSRAPRYLKLVLQHQAAMRLRRLWDRFADWLVLNLDRITPAAVRTYCKASKAVLDRIPLVSEDEKEVRRVTNLDIDHTPIELSDTLAERGHNFQKTRVRGEGGTFSITRIYTNASGESVVDCAGHGRRLSLVTLDRLERP